MRNPGSATGLIGRAALTLLICLAAGACATEPPVTGGTHTPEPPATDGAYTPEPLDLAPQVPLNPLAAGETTLQESPRPTPEDSAAEQQSTPPERPTSRLGAEHRAATDTTANTEPAGPAATDRATASTPTPETDPAAEPEPTPPRRPRLAAHTAADQDCLPEQVTDDDALGNYYDALDESQFAETVECMSPAGRVEALKASLWVEAIPPEAADCVLEGLAPLLEEEPSETGALRWDLIRELMVVRLFVGGHCAGPELLGTEEELSDEEAREIRAIACVVERKGGAGPFTEWLMSSGLAKAGDELESMMAECEATG